MEVGDDLLTAGEVARIFAVSLSTVTLWCEQGKLPYSRTLGGHRRFRRSDIAAIAARTGFEAS